MQEENTFNTELRRLSFRDFLLTDRFNKYAIGFSLFAWVFQLCLFKYYYPFASFINGDSFAYVSTAFYNADIAIYPVGYSKFLRIFNVFTSSDTALVVFQYVFIQASSLLFLFSVFYFHYTNKIIKIILLSTVNLNPVMLFLANYVSSDSIFLGLSICWISTLLWILHCPAWRVIWIHAIVVGLAFTMRYNALYYPVVSVIAFLGNKKMFTAKVFGLVISLALVSGFVLSTSLKYKKLVGKMQFSPFSGWQMANNGIYTYRGVPTGKRVVLPSKFAELDRDVQLYLDTSKTIEAKFPEIMADLNAVYMWSPISPLRTYMNKKYNTESDSSEFERWARIAPLYNEYGIVLMKTYPGVFLKRYVWSNFIKYYSPPVEFLGSYGFNVDTIPKETKRWFDYKESKVHSRFSDNNIAFMDYYPIVCGVMNTVFLMLSLSFFLLKGRSIDRILFQTWVLFFTFWLSNLAFSVFASPIALRFQLFSLLICFASNLLLLDFVLKQAKLETERKKSVLDFPDVAQ